MAIDKSTRQHYDMQGGMKNYLGKQEMVSAPKYWQSRPDKPKTELAYITEAEKDLIMKSDLHGSLSPNVKGLYAPNEGPSGIISLDYQGDKGTYGDAGQSFGDRETYSSRDVTKTGGSHHPGVTGPVKTTIGPTTPKDYFTHSYKEPGFLGLGGGYRELKVPGQTKYGHKSKFGIGNFLGGIAGLLMGIPGLGLITGGLSSLKDHKTLSDWLGSRDQWNPDNTPDYNDMSKYSNLGLYTNRIVENPNYLDFDNLEAINTEQTITPKEKPITKTTETDVLDYLNESA
jgi:hypothetical protein